MTPFAGPLRALERDFQPLGLEPLNQPKQEAAWSIRKNSEDEGSYQLGYSQIPNSLLGPFF